MSVAQARLRGFTGGWRTAARGVSASPVLLCHPTSDAPIEAAICCASRSLPSVGEVGSLVIKSISLSRRWRLSGEKP